MAVDLSTESLFPRFLSVLRAVTAYLFILHGTAKLFGIPHVQMFDDLHLLSLDGLAGVLETFGGAALLLGVCVRPIAFLLCGEMAVAYFIAHAPQGAIVAPILNGGDAAVLFCFIFLFLSAAGGGAWTLKELVQRR
jgi:putative oxidoreductase